MAVRYRAVYAFNGEDAEELSIVVDESLVAENPPEGGWVHVTNASGESGFVPEDFIERAGVVESATAAGAQQGMIVSEQQIYEEPPSADEFPEPPSVAKIPLPAGIRTEEQADVASSVSIPVGTDFNSYNQKIDKRVEELTLDHRTIARNSSAPGSRYSGEASSGDPTKHDPIDGVVSSAMFGKFAKSGQEKYINGKATGSYTQSAQRYDKETIRVTGEIPQWTVDKVDYDGPWNATVLGVEQANGKFMFRMSADPWPKSWSDASLTDIGGVLRKLDHVKWLDQRLRLKFPFIYIPTMSQDPHRPSLLAMNEWFHYITQHPVIRYSHYIYIFLTMSDKENFKKAMKETERRKTGDQNVKEELLRMIDVEPSSKVDKDLQISMANIQKDVTAAQQSYMHTVQALSETLLTISNNAMEQERSFGMLNSHLQRFSNEQEKVAVMGSGSLSVATSRIANIIQPPQSANDIQPDQPSLIDIQRGKVQNQIRFRNRHVAYTECTHQWKDGVASSISSLNTKYEEIIKAHKSEKARLSAGQFNNARARTQNLIAIQMAEHHHQLKINNKNIRDSLSQYMETQIKFMKQELSGYEAMYSALQEVEIPE